jgi:hypothetical protein
LNTAGISLTNGGQDGDSWFIKDRNVYEVLVLKEHTYHIVRGMTGLYDLYE